MILTNDVTWRYVMVANHMNIHLFRVKFFKEYYFSGIYAKRSRREIHIQGTIHIMEKGI